MKNSKTKQTAEISFSRKKPYIVKGITHFSTTDGDKIPVKGVMSLCRCGKTNEEPFCDGSHTCTGFIGETRTSRIKDRVIAYKGEKITILDNRCICSHNMVCIDELPQVFDMDKKRWINPDLGSVDEIIRIIELCPSGSLGYIYKGKTYTGLDREPGILLDKFGPLEVVGWVKLVNDLGVKPQFEEHYTLCRCGKTLNTPFCDGSHFYSIF